MLTVVSIQAGKLLTPTIIRDMFEAVRCYD